MPEQPETPIKAYRLLIFDWDGTLMDSSAHIVHCVQQAAKDLHLPEVDAATIRHGIGLGFMQQMYRLFDVTTMNVEAFSERYQHHHQALNHTGRPPLFEGAEQTLQALKKKNYLLAIATSMGRARLDEALAYYKLNAIFDSSRCADETQSKPDPQMLMELLEELDVSPADAVMIGDTEYDMQLAKNADIDRVAVGYGVHPIEDMMPFKPIACLASVTELLNIF